MSDTAQKLTQTQKDLLRLVQRSQDIGDGWRQVSKMLWPTISGFYHPDLMELDNANIRVRLTPEGQVVLRYTL